VDRVEPLEVLFEEPGAAGPLPEPLAALYGGGLHLADELLYANLIASLDGVTVLAAPRGSGAALRGDCDADRFVMALLRGLADAVLIGAGTLRADRGHLWTPAYIDRRRAELHRTLGRPDPRLVVVTASGDLDPDERALQAGALVLTTDGGAGRLAGRLPAASTVRSLGDRAPAAADILAAVRAEGHPRVLIEGGPTLLARFVGEGLLDELFLTLSPVLAGRRAGDGRLGLLEGVELLPGDGRWARLRSLRASGSHLFLRYAIRPPAAAAGADATATGSAALAPSRR
jgi:riboflavin biosynthesis pyrimidine reductase